MPEINPEELAERRQAADDDLLILDIRHRDEYEDWHIPGSINIDVYDELGDDRAAAKDALDGLPTGRGIVTVCAVGVVSQRATDVLRELGYDAATLEDGMSGWSRVHRNAVVPVDVDGTLVQVARPGKGCLSYVLISDGSAAVFDPSQYVEAYETIVEAYGAELIAVFDTHAHADHVSGGRKLATRHGIPYYLHPDDAISVEATPLEDGESVRVGSVDVDVVHTPGHSEGSVSFDVDGAALLTGDTLFHGSVGRVELGITAGIEDAALEGNAATLYESLQRLLEWPPETVVLPAHDPGSPEPPVTATLREVRAGNGDLGLSREEFVETTASDVPDHPPNFERVKRINVGHESVAEEELADLELGPNRCAAE